MQVKRLKGKAQLQDIRPPETETTEVKIWIGQATEQMVSIMFLIMRILQIIKNQHQENLTDLEIC